MECPVCLIDWNSDTSIPKLLPCGHSICGNCIQSLYKENSKILLCPTCMKEHKLESRDLLQNLIINYALLSIMSSNEGILAKKENNEMRKAQTEDLKRSKTASIDAQIAKSLNDKEVKSENEVQKNEQKDISDDKDEKEEIVTFHVEPNQMCKKHKYLVHSYIKGTSHILCTYCIEELRSQSPNAIVKPIPQVCENLRSKVYNAKNILKKKRLELCEIRNFVDNLKKGRNNTEHETKLQQHFEMLKEIIKTAEEIARQNLSSTIESQKNTMNLFTIKIAEHFDKLSDQEVGLNYLDSVENENLVYLSNTLLDTYNSVMAFDPQVNLKNLQLKFKLNDKLYDKIASFIHHTTSFSLEFPTDKETNKVLTMKDIINEENLWYCLKCETKNEDGQILCFNCHCFRALETYPNILKKPFEVTEKEINELKKRRELEKRIIVDKDKNEEQVNKELFYLMDSTWLAEWKMFVSNKPSNKYCALRLSPNPKIGILPPGPISNNKLLRKTKDNALVPRTKLEKLEDYRGVNEFVWETFERVYGGGPAITRQDLDIYSEEYVISQANKQQHQKQYLKDLKLKLSGSGKLIEEENKNAGVSNEDEGDADSPSKKVPGIKEIMQFNIFGGKKTFFNMFAKKKN